ncbi:MAG: HAD hydrolase-like protein [Pseudomonadota bacterium]
MSAVFLDLDGTLMDSEPGILSSLRSAFLAVGRPDMAATDLRWMIGPPFIDSFKKINVENPQAAIDAYRDVYAAGGMFDAQVYKGIFEMIADLQTVGHRLYLATAKPHVAATQITAHFGLAAHFVDEFGPELDGTRNWKGDLLTYALERTGEDPAQAVMVGDRHHDFAAAASVDMKSIAVRWGYGDEDERREANMIIDQPGELAGAIAALGL